tara:strand:- start:42 stop:359 length:318 start_codon:yes stop_codon:yes gene_type:complete
MKKITHNKLVRDLIPQIIEKDGKKAIFTKIIDSELNEALVKKLSEEGQEFLEAMNIEELADILEIVHALIELNDFELNDVEQIRKSKQEQRGAFKEGIFLEHVLD